MTAAAAPLSPTDLLDQQAGDAQYYRALLHELMDVGMSLVRAVPKQVTAETGDERTGGEEPAAATLHEAAVTFDLLSRAVRRTVALARRVAEPLPQPGPARRRIIHEVEDVSQWPDSALGLDPDLDAEAASAFRAELSERLDRAELDDEIGRRPIEDVVADIRRDLGLDRFLGDPKRAAQPSAAPGSAASVPAMARHVAPHPGRRPFTPEGGTELRHEVPAVQNE